MLTGQFFLFKLILLSAVLTISTVQASEQCAQLFSVNAQVHRRAKDYQPKSFIEIDQVFLGTDFLHPEKANWKAAGPHTINISTSARPTYHGIYRKRSLSGEFKRQKHFLIEIPNEKIHASHSSNTITDFSFIASSQTPGVTVTVHVPMVTGTISPRANDIFVFQFTPTAEAKSYTIPISKNITQKQLDALGRSLNTRNVFIIIEPGQNAVRFELSLYGPMFFERNVQKTFKRLMSENRVNFAYYFREYTAALRKAINNLHDEKVHQQVLSAVKSIGNEGIIAELARDGFKPYNLEGKATDADFFSNSDFAGRALREPLIPIETGSFAVDHGAYSHAYQIYAMTRGMNASQKKDFVEFYMKMFEGVDGWQMWVWLFDSPGARFPNTPRFWRNLIDL